MKATTYVVEASMRKELLEARKVGEKDWMSLLERTIEA